MFVNKYMHVTACYAKYDILLFNKKKYISDEKANIIKYFAVKNTELIIRMVDSYTQTFIHM